MEGLTQNEKIIWNCWDEKSSRDVVREAANKGTHIKLAVKYLMKKNSWNESTALDWFYAEVKSWTIQLLMGKQIFKVRHILNKINVNPEIHLMTLAQSSADNEYRDFIVENLVKQSDDIKIENTERWINLKNHWGLLVSLEKSFEVAGTFKQNKVFGFGKDRIIVTETEIKSMTIEKIEKYDSNWKSKIASALFFQSFDFSLLVFSSPKDMWTFLVEQNKAMILIHWINVQMSEVVRDMNARYIFFNNENFLKKLLNVDTKGLTNDVLEKLDNVFRIWPITNEMIDSIGQSNCFDYTKMCIYDTLCSYGIVIESEKKNLHQIIARLARTQNLKIIDEIFTESCATLTKSEFYVEFAKYCVKNKLYKVLTMCIEGNILNTDLTDVELEAKQCIELWLLFKSIEQTSDRQSHVVPVYKTCEQIAKDNVVDYISSNPLLMLGMILLEDNAKLFDIFNKNEYIQFKDFNLPNTGYKSQLPHLLDVHKKFQSVTSMSEIKDVNMYQLLSGYRGLDVSKVFEFQMLSRIPNSPTEDKPDRRSLGSLIHSEADASSNFKHLNLRSSGMPDFANEKLIKRYGYVAKLNHIYYLKQYRPCNASQAFVAHQYQTYNRLQDKSIKSACCEAHALALQNWNDSSMNACAISFVAMIGCNPTRCRVHISAAKMIKQHLIDHKSASQDNAIKTVNDYMTKLMQCNDEGAREILNYLEEIVIFKLKEKLKVDNKLDVTEILYESQTVIKFAMLHNLPLPEMQLREFITKEKSWFKFLLFGDVFRYPLNQMLQLSQEFEEPSYAEHLKYIMLYRNAEDVIDKDFKSLNNGQRRVSRLNSMEASSSQSSNSTMEMSLSVPSSSLWEVAGACHGPEDPPAALLKAATQTREPLLVLIASCYEPNAVELLWSQWLLTSLPKSYDIESNWDSDMTPADHILKIASICLKEGYIVTLRESMLIFMPDSPLEMLTSFLCRCIHQHLFDSESRKILSKFLQHCHRRYSTDTNSLQLSKEDLQKIAVKLVEISLCECFDSSYQQKNFLKCLSDTQFEKEFSVPAPHFAILYEVLQISMETPTVINVSKMLNEDYRDYLSQCIEMYTDSKNYPVALKIANLAELPVNEILIAEWSNNYETLQMKDNLEEKECTKFICHCSEAFKKASVSFKDAVQFLSNYADEIKDTAQRFYSYRIILSWFVDNREYGDTREKVEYMMWDSYFKTDPQFNIFISSYEGTFHYVANDQKDSTISNKLALINAEKPFSMTLNEIETESDIGNIGTVVPIDDFDMIERWRKVINQLLGLKLVVDAFRLSALFKDNVSSGKRMPPCPVHIVRTCLKLAEGLMSPYDIPQDLRLVISSPYLQRKINVSESLDGSFEEVVEIQNRNEGATSGAAPLACREDADRLLALEALVSKSSAPKQVASYYRIALQIGWPYLSVLKHQKPPLDLINLVSGRAKMSLANLVFRTFNVPSKQIADYFCREMVSAIISPHLVKTSTFRQKEHFQYTLWGYALNADIEMFLNMRPDACSHIGRLVLEHLMAFRKIYKSSMAVQLPDDTLDDSSLDVDTLIDEEYHYIDGDETASSMTESGTILSTDTESVYSMSTVVGPKLPKDIRRNLFDIITKSNVHIRYEIKSNIRKITKGAKLSTKQVNIISIELLVLASECFSCACDTEGVATVLRSAHALTTQLLASKSWRLMARLLTGLGRYTDTAYIFQALRQNHQFEYLLGQFDYMIGHQPDKINEFKHGLLDFLKTHCPGDTDTYIMVALHFNMHSEAADVKRKQAADLINDLEKLAVDGRENKRKKEWPMIHDNPTTRSLLETALNHSTDAAELYLQAGCTGLAGEMAARAQEIALQISLLKASPTRLILNVTLEQKYKLVIEYLGFMEGLVYMATSGSQWRQLAYRRALTNDQPYLRDCVTFRPDVAHDILNRYKNEKHTTVSKAAMEMLRSLCR